MSTPLNPTHMRSTAVFDRVGSIASSACAVHCVLCALLPTALATLGMGALMGPRVEWVFALIALACALGALLWGRAQINKRPLAAAALMFGIFGLVVSRWLELTSHHAHDHAPSSHVAQTHEHADHHAPEHAEHSDHKGDEDAHEDEDHGHEDGGHLAGSLIGILSGLSLLAGHVLSLRRSKQSADECC